MVSISFFSIPQLKGARHGTRQERRCSLQQKPTGGEGMRGARWCPVVPGCAVKGVTTHCWEK